VTITLEFILGNQILLDEMAVILAPPEIFELFKGDLLNTHPVIHDLLRQHLRQILVQVLLFLLYLLPLFAFSYRHQQRFHIYSALLLQTLSLSGIHY